MKRSQISYATVMIMMAVVLSMAMLPLGAQDDWPGGCQLPDLEEVMNAANSAQAEGDVAAYVNSLSEINRQADKALKDCLAAAVEADVDLRETDLSYAHLQGGIRGGWVSPQLQEADLSYANLSESGFLVANLQGADLSHATLLGSGLTDANLQEARLSYASLL